MLNAEEFYSESFYLINNPDVAATVARGIISSGFEHFIESGQFQVRQPSPLYNENYYIANNPDVEQAIIEGFFVSGFQHYIEIGQFQNRNPGALFDGEYYLTENPDLIPVVQQGNVTAIEHFVKFGQFEGRSPSPFYNNDYYISQNPDVIDFLELDQLTGIEHYLEVGAAQEREFTPFIEPRGSTLPNQIGIGDPTQTSVVLFTRGSVAGELIIEYATNPDFNTVLERIETLVIDPLTPIKIELNNLTPGTQYFVRVTDAARTVEDGSFRTLEPLGTQAGIRFGATGSTQGELAPYPAVANVPARNLDFFVNLGDTIYADSNSPDLPNVEQVETELGFETKYNEVYSQRSRLNTWGNLWSSTPIYTVWDDHNIIEGFAGGISPTDPLFPQPYFGTDGDFVNDTSRFQTALDAFQEYHPVREEFYGETEDLVSANQPKLYRFNTHGNDAATFILDVRSFRDAPLLALPEIPTVEQTDQFLSETFAPGRTLLGNTQLEELKQDLLTAEELDVTWKFIFSPVPIQNLALPDTEDRWEGYAAERTNLLQFIDENNIENVVFISGSLNGTIVNNLTYQIGFDQPQIQTDIFEVTVGATAVQLELEDEQLAATLGSEIVALTPDVLLTPEEKEFYQDLSNRFSQDKFIENFINNRLNTLEYDPIGLDNSNINAELIEGSYTNVHTFGWTEFLINPQTQNLTVTTYGIRPYTQTEVTATPAFVVNRLPEVVSQFIVTPNSTSEE
ncbi:MAG: alkaline phosphatase D family protein [Microcoleaceae cyanobacterium]